MNIVTSYLYDEVINEICGLRWASLSREELTEVAWAYYFFSVQFRENLQIARRLYPDDPKLRQLEQEECDTANLSPWPGVASAHERLDHDEFMRRLLELSPIDPRRRSSLEEIGYSYLANIRDIPLPARAASIGSYEDGGLERVFKAFLTAHDWYGPLLGAFRHFLAEYIRFDSDPEQGHGALSRHMAVDDRILPIWMHFKQLLLASVPGLET